MTGNFKIIVIENIEEPTLKWTIHKDNIDDKKHSLKNVCPYFFKENYPSIKKTFNHLFSHDGYSSRILSTDSFRKPTLSEYLVLGVKLREVKMKYNKKKDILITK